MAEQWIPAAQARQIVNDPVALCIRLHAGLLTARARLLKSGDDQGDWAIVPKNFWWAEGQTALDQNWDVGDFSTWIDQKQLVQAFGVSIGLSGLLEMIANERRPALRRSLSIVGSPDWMSARDAQRITYANWIHRAGEYLIEQARLGLIAAKAVEASGVKNYSNFFRWDWEEREWEIPTWYWGEFGSGKDAQNDWELGRFSGHGIAPMGSRLIELSGVHFLREQVQASVGEAPAKAIEVDQPARGRRPTYDWPKATAAIWGKLFRGELIPENQAEIEKALQVHLAVDEKEPSESTVRPFAKLIWEEFQKA